MDYQAIDRTSKMSLSQLVDESDDTDSPSEGDLPPPPPASPHESQIPAPTHDGQAPLQTQLAAKENSSDLGLPAKHDQPSSTPLMGPAHRQEEHTVAVEGGEEETLKETEKIVQCKRSIKMIDEAKQVLEQGTESKEANNKESVLAQYITALTAMSRRFITVLNTAQPDVLDSEFESIQLGEVTVTVIKSVHENLARMPISHDDKQQILRSGTAVADRSIALLRAAIDLYVLLTPIAAADGDHHHHQMLDAKEQIIACNNDVRQAYTTLITSLSRALRNSL